MEEAESGGGGGRGAESARVMSSFQSLNGRQRFTVELRPGETTIVSWKKLLKDAAKLSVPTCLPEPPSNAHPVLESRMSPGQPATNEVKDAPPTGRYSAVIEKIERLYVGKHSSDEEDLNNVPDDEYDTEDSFIDDSELDEYFQVDNSVIKHDGFFINRGKLEHAELTSLPNQQSKKRRRKEVAKDVGGSEDVCSPNKHVKAGKKATGKSVQLVGKNSGSPSHNIAIPIMHHEDVKSQNQMNFSEISSNKRSSDTKNTKDPFSSRNPNGDAAVEEGNMDKQKSEVPSSKTQIKKLKEGNDFFDPSNQRSNDKSSSVQCMPQPGGMNNVNDLDQMVQQREKNGSCEWPDVNFLEDKNSLQMVKVPLMQRREGASVRPKTTMLEKAIRELEKLVAISRPPSSEVQDADISSQAVKRRLPPEIKQKLAKVARLAQASHGKISKELINRLMSIVGHLIQLRTLKRNLKVMVSMGLSAKEEKDNRFQQIKKEVIEMIKVRVPLMKAQVLEQQVGAANNVQEIGAKEKEVLKRKFGLDDALEDKICDLYELYVEGLEEDIGPLVRKLYTELVELWPSGFMNKYGIKRAICRAKQRRRLNGRHKDQEGFKRKKVLIPKKEVIVRVEGISTAQPQYIQEKLVTDSISHGLTSLTRAVTNTTATSTTVRMPIPFINEPSMDCSKHDGFKGSTSNNDNMRTDALMKKKVKRKLESELVEAQLHLDKLTSLHGEERNKSHKQVAGSIQTTNLQSSGPPSTFQQS